MIKKHSTLTVIFAVLFVILLAAAIILWPTIFGGDGDNTITINAVEGEHILIGSADIAVRDILSGNVSDEIKSLVSLKDDGTLSAPRYTRQLIFEKVDRENIQALEVSNEHGSYKIFRNAADNFELEGFPGLIFDDMVFSYLVVAAGHTEVQLKMTDDATEADYAEYGLDKPIAHWTITTISGDRHTVYIGSNLLTDGGYYVQYEGRDSIYILNNTMQYALLQPAETLITPLLTAGMTQNDYFYAENFMIFHGEDLFIRLTNKTPEEMSNPEAIVEPKMTFPSGYEPNTELYYGTLYNFASMVGTETVKIGTDEEILKQYGLYEPAYTVAYNFNDYSFFVFVSEKQEDGTYYATSNLYNFQLIAKVGSDMLGFLDERFFTWISDYPFQPNIKEVDTIQILSPDGTTDVHFKLHHGIDSDTNPTLEADIVSADGRRGFINNDYISNFRQFYKTLLSIQLHEETTPLTEEQITDIVKDDNLLLTFSYKLLTGEEVEYKFYQYSTRRALVTINGVGEFYVYVDMSDKIISDTEKVLVGLDIDSYGKK